MKKKILLMFAVSVACLAAHAQYWVPNVPYNLRPDVAAENAYNQMMNQMTEHYWDNVNPNQINTVPNGVDYSTATPPPSSNNSTNSSPSSNSPRRSQHDMCNGTGKCRTCNGSGLMWVGSNKKRCVNCSGSGRCSGCNGTGRSSAHYY